MRNGWALAIVFWLIVPAAPILCQQQEPASSPDLSGQPSAVPQPPPESAPSPAAVVPESPDNRPQETQKPRVKPKPKRHTKRTAKVPSTNDHRKVVVQEGGASEPPEQITPGMSPEEATRQRKNAQQWLGFTNDLLKQLEARNLDTPQQETVGHIKNFEKNASLALNQGELRRASTLAEKAYLLADDLVKH